LVALLVVWVVLAVSPASAGDGLPSGSPTLRERFGFDPLKRMPLVVIYRMDLAGNENGVLEDEEIPPAARDFVDELLGEARIKVAGPVQLGRLAVSWQQHAAGKKRPMPTSFAIHRDVPRADETPTKAGRPSLDELRGVAHNVVRCFDTSGNGSLEPDEWRSFNPAWDRSDDGSLNAAELTAAFDRIEQRRFDLEASTATGEIGRGRPGAATNHNGSAPARSRTGPPTRPYRFRGPYERLPAGVPDWFVQRDHDRDGQVMMSEFAADWTDDKVRHFYRYDLNRDGVITPRECLSAPGQD
jgi:hypothetical protein